MEKKETQNQYKKESTSIFSLFSSEEKPNLLPRRIKSDPLPVSTFSLQLFSEQNMTNDPLIEMNDIQEMKQNNDIGSNNVLLNSNSYGFKGRSPYVASSDIQNVLNKTFSNIITNYENNNNSSPKIINGFIFTELKDKIFEYRCSVCNFIAHDNGDLHKHLILNNHFILPKKYKKGHKSKIFHKPNNASRLNQTFIFPLSKHKKYSDKKIICKHCSKRFESNYALNSHLNAHKYKCDICYKLFNNKEDLLEHKHILEQRNKEMNSPFKKKRNKFYKGHAKDAENKIEIDDWEEVQSSKKEKIKEKKNTIGESYAFIDNDENIDFNKMIKVNDGINF